MSFFSKLFGKDKRKKAEILNRKNMIIAAATMAALSGAPANAQNQSATRDKNPPKTIRVDSKNPVLDLMKKIDNLIMISGAEFDDCQGGAYDYAIVPLDSAEQTFATKSINLGGKDFDFLNGYSVSDNTGTYNINMKGEVTYYAWEGNKQESEKKLTPDEAQKVVNKFSKLIDKRSTEFYMKASLQNAMQQDQKK